MKPLSLSLILGFLWVIMGCSKPENTNNTHTSTLFTDTTTNFLRCSINGNSWHSTPDSVSAKWMNHRRELYITAYNYSNGHEVECMAITLRGADTIVAGTGGLNIQYNAAYLNIFPQTNDTVTYHTDNIYTGSVSYWFDYSAHRVSGDFYFTGGRSTGSDVYTFTKGEFSMPYVTTD